MVFLVLISTIVDTYTEVKVYSHEIQHSHSIYGWEDLQQLQKHKILFLYDKAHEQIHLLCGCMIIQIYFILDDGQMIGIHDILHHWIHGLIYEFLIIKTIKQ